MTLWYANFAKIDTSLAKYHINEMSSLTNIMLFRDLIDTNEQTTLIYTTALV